MLHTASNRKQQILYYYSASLMHRQPLSKATKSGHKGMALAVVNNYCKAIIIKIDLWGAAEGKHLVAVHDVVCMYAMHLCMVCILVFFFCSVLQIGRSQQLIFTFNQCITELSRSHTIPI